MPNPQTVGIITQARTSSTRLPEKILIPIKGKEVLKHHVERLERSGLPVFVATSVDSSDDKVEEFCRANHWNYFRGSLHDVLARYYECARNFELEHVVRVTSDCPLVDGELIGKMVKDYLSKNDDSLYYSNCLERTYPRGFDFEIFSLRLLKEAFEKATEDAFREHVTPYINRNINGKVHFLHCKRAEDASQYRLTIDTADDLKLIKLLIEQYDADQLSAESIIEVMKAHPELHEINRHIEQKKV